MYYQGAQCPFGVAVFDGTLVQLAAGSIARLFRSGPPRITAASRTTS